MLWMQGQAAVTGLAQPMRQKHNMCMRGYIRLCESFGVILVSFVCMHDVSLNMKGHFCTL